MEDNTNLFFPFKKIIKWNLKLKVLERNGK